MSARLAAITMLFGAWMTISGDCRAQMTQSPDSRPGGTLAVMGHSGTTALVKMNGRSYVDLEALTRLLEGSLSYTRDDVTLTLPAAREAPEAEAQEGFSKPFMEAGIEQMAVIREWRVAIMDSVQNNYPISESWVSAQLRRADRNLKLAATAASTDDDRSAVPLLTAELKNVEKLSDRILAKRRQASYIPPRSLNNDPLDKQILACAQSMAAMVANNAFVDDANCRESRN
jgi:hypothetical protein